MRFVLYQTTICLFQKQMFKGVAQALSKQEKKFKKTIKQWNNFLNFKGLKIHQINF